MFLGIYAVCKKSNKGDVRNEIKIYLGISTARKGSTCYQCRVYKRYNLSKDDEVGRGEEI